MRAVGGRLVLLVLSFTLIACGGSSSGKSKDKTDPIITLTGWYAPQSSRSTDVY